MTIVNVIRRDSDGWHTFTSPELPGLHLSVQSNDLRELYNEIPKAIEGLYAIHGEHVLARATQKLPSEGRNLPGRLRYSIERAY